MLRRDGAGVATDMTDREPTRKKPKRCLLLTVFLGAQGVHAGLLDTSQSESRDSSKQS